VKQRFSVVIAGAGMIGLAVAALLARSRHHAALDITVIDAGPRPAFDRADDVGLRVSAVSLGSARLLDSIGAWQPVVDTRACGFDGMRVWDARSAQDGPETLVFDAADFGVPELGFIAENALIRQALLDVVSSSGVDLRFSTPFGGLEPADRETSETGGFELRLDSGERLRPDLVIGADGAGSGIRRGAEIPVRAWKYSQSAFVTHVRSEHSHRNIAWQRFLRTGPIALLPLADGRSSVVWSTAPEQVEEAMSAEPGELGEKLTRAIDGVLGALTVDGPRGSFPLKAQHATRYVQPGLALVGDAAHSVHPLAGQGANLGFADAEALSAALLAAIDRQEYPGDLPTLRRYERARRGANATMLRFIDSINRLFASEQGFFAGARVRGMRLFNRSGPIRRKAVEVALGINL